MASLTIEGIQDSLLDSLRKRAERHGRSLNSEVLQILESSAASHLEDVEGLLTRIHRLRERAPLPQLTDAILEQAIEEGRP